MAPRRLVRALASAPSIALMSAALTASAAIPLVAQRPARQPAARAAQQVPPERVATVEGITEYRLPNGLRILFFPDASRPSTTVNITYYVGSRHEGYGESGMAHLLEHLMFKGTPTHLNIPQELTEHGGRANGSTWYDRTNYFITFPTSAENLEWAIRFEADRMVNSFVRQQDLASEMTVVRNEFEAGENNPMGVLLQRTLSTAFLWHGYGRSTIGARADIEHVPIERLQAFYRRYYQPDNAILVVSGRFDEPQTLQWIARDFGAIRRLDRTGDLRLWGTYTREPTQDGERQVTVRRVGSVQYVMAAYHVPPGAHEDFAGVDLLAHVLGNAPSGRLYRALVESARAARVAVAPFQLQEPGVLLAYAEVRADQALDSVRAILVRTLDDLAANPPTDQEVERARASRLRDIQLTINNSESVGIGLTEWAATGDWRLMFIHRDRIRAATTADVGRVARTYLLPANRTIGLFVPDSQPRRAEIPDVPDIAAVAAAYRGTQTVSAGEVFDPTPANVEARLRRLELANGFRIGLLPKQTRGGTVYLQFAQRMGTEAELMNRGTPATLAGAMLMRGTARRSRQELIDTLARLQAQMSVSGGAAIVSGSIETTRANLPAALRLLGEVLREPAFDAAEFETLKRERLASLESQRTEPTMLAIVAFSRHMSPRPRGHAQYTETLDEGAASLQATTLDDVRRFYREFYGTGSGGNLTVLGDFDPAEIEALARQLFGDWPRQRPYVRIGSPYQDVRDTVITIETPDKPNAFMMAGLNFEMRDDHPDYPALLLGGYMLGGGFLNSRLAARIRQREGLSYGVGAAISARPLDRSGSFTGNAIFAPQNADRLVAAFREEVERAVRDGFTPEEVAAAKRGWQQQRDVSRATDAQLTFTIHNGLFLGRTLTWDADLEARVQALTPEQINQAMRRHIDPARITIVKAGDFARRGN